MLNNTFSSIAAFVRPIYELIYPPTCLACERYLHTPDKRICPECWSRIRRLTPDDELYREKLGQLISKGNISGFASVFHFEKDGVLQALIHQLKYREMTSVGIELGRFVRDSVDPMLGRISFDALVPVPLHPARERERGYNQSEVICRGMGKGIGIPTCRMLKRVRHTKTQTKLDAHERKENVADAFALNHRYRRRVAGGIFLLVDDIITTGATVDECAKVLKQHGAEKIFAASIGLPDHTHLP